MVADISPNSSSFSSNIASTNAQTLINTITTTTITTTSSTNFNPTIPHPNIVKHNSDTTPSPCNSSTVRRQRHSLSGQMSYYKMLGFGGFSKKMATSTNSLFSTAVISGSSSAPNLRDMIPCTASSSGKLKKNVLYKYFKICMGLLCRHSIVILMKIAYCLFIWEVSSKLFRKFCVFFMSSRQYKSYISTKIVI